MPLETGTYISDFVLTNPDGDTDTVASLDDQDRLIKTFVQNSFPNINAAVTASPGDLNATVNFEETISATTSQVTVATGKLFKVDEGKLMLGSSTVTPSATELNILDGVTSNTAELNILDGVTATASDLNKTANIGNGALVYLSSVQSISNASNTIINFDSEQYDTDSIHDNVTNNSRLTVPSGITYIRLWANVTFANNTTGIRSASILKNGVTTYDGYVVLTIPAATGTFTTTIPLITPVINVTATDYFELEVYQNSGGSLNAVQGNYSTRLAMELIV